MKPAPFAYAAPDSLAEALALLADGGASAKPLAGGQSLVPVLAFRIIRPTLLVDLNGVGELGGVELDGTTLRVGAMARHRDVERLAGLGGRCPMIAEAVAEIGHVAIRNRGTVGGSLAHADPAAEWGALALALDGQLELRGEHGGRTVPAAEFFQTFFTTALAAGELLTAVRFRLPPPGAGSAFVELSRRHGDFAVCGVAASVTLGPGARVADCRIALIGAADRPLRAHAAEAALRGRVADGEALAAAAAAVDGDIDPVGDLHASERYRRRAAGVLTRRALERALTRTVEGGDA